MYNYSIKHIVGWSNVTEYLSRQPMDICYRVMMENPVSSTVVGAVPPTLIAHKVEQASEKDVELSTMRQCTI